MSDNFKCECPAQQFLFSGDPTENRIFDRQNKLIINKLTQKSVP